MPHDHGVDNCSHRFCRNGRQLELGESRSPTQIFQRNLLLASHGLWAYVRAFGLGLMVMRARVKTAMAMIPPVRGWTGPDWTSPGLVQSSPRSFWTGIGPVPNSVGPGLDWSVLAWTSPALYPGLGYISHCIGLLMGEIYLDGTEYTDITVIISPRAGIHR
jgi:hypothetical protein